MRNKFGKKARIEHSQYINNFRCSEKPLYGEDIRNSVTIENKFIQTEDKHFPNNLILTNEERAISMKENIEKFSFLIPNVRSKPEEMHISHPNPSTQVALERFRQDLITQLSPKVDPYWSAYIRSQLYFPDKRLIQYDCGKLQALDLLLRQLKSGGHKALLFTQMSKMLDILEIFLNIYGYTYLRLDGSTKIEMRQILTERFNNDKRIFIFILSTRSGGLGINLTGADTVIFYDSDWNPAMDQQAQDRSHRIGQTREVHIYRLISEHTIEENILKKSKSKKNFR